MKLFSLLLMIPFFRCAPEPPPPPPLCVSVAQNPPAVVFPTNTLRCFNRDLVVSATPVVWWSSPEGEWVRIRLSLTDGTTQWSNDFIRTR